jgi:hypothetical protein
MNPKDIVVHKGTLNLKGFTRFAFFAPKEGRIITDGYTVNFLECTAELIFSDNQNFILKTKEFIPDDSHMFYRGMSIKGKITPNGGLKFSSPEKWIELGEEHTDLPGQFKEHTGCVLSGEDIIKNIIEFRGIFDGTKFYAENHATVYQEAPGNMPFFAKIVDGPIKLNMVFDLEVSE